MPYLGIFGLEFEKKYHILNQHPRICITSKFHELMKTPKFWIKNALCGYFWVRILKMLLSYLKSTLSSLSNCKISRKNKND